ncbi:MAG: hypothetical protein K5768_04730 [Firmicutes bacterium]|nr:hypothetical protein [Bacillota bacterium]
MQVQILSSAPMKVSICAGHGVFADFSVVLLHVKDYKNIIKLPIEVKDEGFLIDLQKEMLFVFLNREEMQEKQTKEMLFERQKQTLDNFLERNAISKEQYDTSLKVLKEKLLK